MCNSQPHLAVQFIDDGHVEGRSDVTLFLVPRTDIVVVGAVVGQPVDRPRLGMAAEAYRLVVGEQFVEIHIAQAVRLLTWSLTSDLPAYSREWGTPLP